MMLEYNEWKLDKPFKIYLEDGVIHSLSVDSAMTSDQVNQLKVIVSQLQVDTRAHNLIKSTVNAPEGNKALYNVMEPNVFGNCETRYNVTPLSNFLHQSHPVPRLKDEDEFIKIEKTRNSKNCVERSDAQNELKSDGSNLFSVVTHIILSGNLSDYTIQSSTASSNEGNFSDYIGVTLESVSDSAILQEHFVYENLIHTAEGLSQVNPIIQSRAETCKKASGE